MHTDAFATRHTLAAAIQDRATAECAWCRHPYAFQAGCGVFCSTSCRDAELTGGSGPALRSAHQVEQDRRTPDTLHDDLLRSVVLAQGKAIQKLKEQVSGLLARETV